MNTKSKRRLLISLSLLVLVAGLGALGAVLFGGKRPKPVVGSVDPDLYDQEALNRGLPVKTIRPRRDASFRLSVRQLASVEPFYEAGLRARTAGVIKYIQKDLHDQVRQGELLIELDAPEVLQDVAQKDAVVDQRLQELRLARVNVKHAEAEVEVGIANVAQRKTEVTAAQATLDLRRKRLARFRDLAAGNAINQDLVDEQERETQAGQAALESARVAVQKAQADLKEKEASLEAAHADVDLKDSFVNVARKDRDRARAVADFTRITAPFDGFVSRRNVDLGTFVQNANTSASEPLMVISRLDVVTVGAKLPDNVAPFLTRDTEVTIEMDELPGVLIQGRITRFSPSIINQDRTIRVEVDLFNAGEQEYQRFLRETITSGLAGLASRQPFGAATYLSGAVAMRLPHRKGSNDRLPLRPLCQTGTLLPYGLLPGMSGYMRVSLNDFHNAYLLPSGAVFSRGGKQYILVVKEGIAQFTPVRVQVNDGTLAKVVLLPRAGEMDVVRELTGEEEVILNRQAEISEGQAVIPTLTKW
jgi:multidrug resistance efflux pump